MVILKRIKNAMNIFPTQYEKSVWTIDFSKLYQLGYQGIIFDIDATLVPHGRDATQEVKALFRSLHQLGFKTLLLSNNNEARIKRFNEDINTHYIHSANKPNAESYLRALDILALDKQAVIFIGDQLFTDILGANRCGIANILVDYLPQQGETKLGKKRTVEKWLMSLYRFLPKSNTIGQIS